MTESSREDRTASSRLLSRARQGDRSAIGLLFQRHAPILRRWAHSRLPRWARALADTADLVQDAFFNTFRRFDRFVPRGEKALQAYLRNAVQHRIIDILRKSETRLRGGELTGEEPDSQPSPLAQAISAQENQRYRFALSQLGKDDQSLIVGRFELGYSYEQLALISGRATPEAARIALRRALARLTEQMSRD